MSKSSSDRVVSLLFIDNMGRVIFANDNLLSMIGYAEAGAIVGEPLHRILGLDLATEIQLLRDVSAAKHIDEQALDLFDRDQNIIRVRYTATASYNHEGSFIGADLTLRLLTDQVESGQTQTHDNQDNRIETNPQSLEDLAHLRAYFTDRVEALQTALMQIGGPRLRDTLHRIINETAQKYEWLVYISPNQIAIEDKDTDINAQSAIYWALLAKALAYTVNVLGPAMVAKKMHAVDERTEVIMIDLADRLSLREIVI